MITRCSSLPLSFANLSSCINSAANFLVYMLRGKKFRVLFLETYFCRRARRRRRRRRLGQRDANNLNTSIIMGNSQHHHHNRSVVYSTATNRTENTMINAIEAV